MSTYCLNVQHCEYVSEWRYIYEEIVNFIFYMNHEFRQLAVSVYIIICKRLFFSSYQNNYSIGDLVLFSIVCIKYHCKYDLYCILPDVNF